MKTVVRVYQPEDRSACEALWVELTQHHRDIYDDPTIRVSDPAQGFKNYLANPSRRLTWVAVVDGQVVGMAGIIVWGEEGEVEPVIVSGNHRSRGIGRILVNHAVSHAKETGIRFLSVRPVARNVEALSFFVEAGFSIVGHIDLFQDLAPKAGRRWKSGINIHGKELRY